MSYLFDLTGTTAVVTGSSRGIGLGIARVLLGQGARIVINGYNPDETDAAMHQLRGEFTATAGTPAPDDEDVDEALASTSERVVGCAGDVSDPAVAAQLAQTALDAFGRLDHLVCNAGIDIIKDAVDYTALEWDRVLGVNLRGAFLPAQAVARHWIATGSPGSITMTSSIAGSVGVPTLAPYAASKGGVDQLVRTLAAEWAPHGIRVNAVAPGYVDNIMDAVTAHDDPASDARIATFTPLGRRASISEIAAPYALLASRAAGYITGAVLPVDGGYTAT